MCGIAGVWTRSETPDLQGLVATMGSLLSHRGPDDSGAWVDAENGVALAHRRLSIIDLSPAGHQPMAGAGGRTHITFNGEIYDYLESRRKLEGEGHRFRTASDTEVILALYDRYGLDFPRHLRGMFAIALWDGATRRMILVRDRSGKKPLYYAQAGGALYFASELNALVPVLPAPPSIDTAALDEYLTFGHISGLRTIYQEIHEVPAGALVEATGPDSFRTTRYWQPQWEPKRAIGFREAVEECDRILTEAVKLRLRADVPVGVFLSGGVDSGLVASIAARNLPGRLLTFSVGFDEQEFDERKPARQVALLCGSEHREAMLTVDVASMVPTMAWHYGEPFGDASAIPSFLISEYASRHVKVVLNGDGGDEVFGGYRRHQAAALSERMRRVLPPGVERWVARSALRCLPATLKPRSKAGLIRRFLQSRTATPIEGLLSWYADGLTREEKGRLYRDANTADHALQVFRELLKSLDSIGTRDRALALDLLWQLPDDLMPKMDIASMAYGLEARSPFLDQVLVDWANTLPENIRLGECRTKPILRALAKRYLPESVVHAPKRGFEVPLARLLRNGLREMRDDLILSRTGIMASLFKRPALERWIREEPANPNHWAQSVWNLLMLAAWERHCYKVSKPRIWQGACAS